MTSQDKLQGVATTSGALEGHGKVNVWNPSTLALCQLPLTPQLKLIIAGFSYVDSVSSAPAVFLSQYILSEIIIKPEKSSYFKIRCLMTPG